MPRTRRTQPLLTAALALTAAGCVVARAGFIDPGVNAEHPIARRSAFPQPGETIDTPIPAVRLSDEEQFVKDIAPADIPAIVPWDRAGQYVGHEITAQGRVVTLGKSGNVNFLNFDPDWRDKFYIVIFDDLAQTLDASVEQTFQNKLIRVRGKVETHRGRPQMRITSMEQVEFVDE